VGLEALLVLPGFHDGEMIRSIALLQDLKTHQTCVRATRLAIMSEQFSGLSCGRWHDFDIGHDVGGAIA
jgi:hypothetical protein